MTIDQSAVLPSSKFPDLDVEPRIAPAAKLMASINRLSGLLHKIEQAEAQGQWPGGRPSGVTMHCEASRESRRLLMISAASSTDEFLAEIRPLLEGAPFDQAELVFVIPPELNECLLEQMGRFIAKRVFIEPLSSSAAADLRSSSDEAARGRQPGSALDRELAMFESFYQPLDVSPLVRLHEAYATYLDAVGPASSCRVWTTRRKGK